MDFKNSSILERIPRENFQTSTKIEALKEEMDGSAKGIFISQFTSFLDLISYYFQQVFTMEPWLNHPSFELQACDQIYRIGGYKPVRVKKFIIKNSIEEKILELQQKKESLSGGAPTGKLGNLFK